MISCFFFEQANFPFLHFLVFLFSCFFSIGVLSIIFCFFCFFSISVVSICFFFFFSSYFFFFSFLFKQSLAHGLTLLFIAPLLFRGQGLRLLVLGLLGQILSIAVFKLDLLLR